MLIAISIIVGLALVAVLWVAFGRKRPIELQDDGAEPKAAPTKPSQALPAQPAQRAEPEARTAEAVAPQAAVSTGAAIKVDSAAAEPAREPAAEPGAPSAPSKPPAHEQSVQAMRQGLANTRGGFIARLARLFGAGKAIDKGLLDEIEEVLIGADLGIRTTERILEALRERMQRGELADDQAVWSCLRAQAEQILDVPASPMALGHKPAVVLMVGVNGVGKTTTIGKLASRFVAQGKKVLLAAGDTYRAAAVLQLEMWGKRVGCPVVKGKDNADPGSVIFEAINRARAEGYDIVLADTAGRLHTKLPLMDELKKVVRTIAKANDGREPDEVLLVLDSTTGQNAVQQMKMFREALAVTGVVLTKLDGTAKGGVVLGLVEQHAIPVRFVGLGERVEDLREFDAHTFVEALFSKPTEATLAA
jgi:fused signal recognition particle receptor